MEIARELEKEYGKGETGWWRQGIPEVIRVKCKERQEKDQEFVADPYCYTDLLDLVTILDKQWKVLSKRLPKDVGKDKKALLNKLEKLNPIRRKVMHPVRGEKPSEVDFKFTHKLKQSLV